jgi:hypothetical protein
MAGILLYENPEAAKGRAFEVSSGHPSAAARSVLSTGRGQFRGELDKIGLPLAAGLLEHAEQVR